MVATYGLPEERTLKMLAGERASLSVLSAPALKRSNGRRAANRAAPARDAPPASRHRPPGRVALAVGRRAQLLEILDQNEDP